MATAGRKIGNIRPVRPPDEHTSLIPCQRIGRAGGVDAAINLFTVNAVAIAINCFSQGLVPAQRWEDQGPGPPVGPGGHSQASHLMGERTGRGADPRTIRRRGERRTGSRQQGQAREGTDQPEESLPSRTMKRKRMSPRVEPSRSPAP